MKNLSTIGRIFYGLAIAAMGLQTIYTGRFPYMMIPPNHSWIPPLVMYIFGAMLIFAGVCIVIEKKARLTSPLFACLLLLVFCFYFIPYQFMSGTFNDFGEWENAEKELALSGGAFVISGCFPGKNENPFIRYLTKRIPFGAIIFSLTMICFGIDHFLGPKGVADYTPAWVPFKMFWAYFCGTALIGSGIAIIFRIKPGVIAALLGTMIFSWFIILHIPKVIAAPSSPEMRGELTSAFLALAYSGIAYVIAGSSKIKNTIK
jgi:uncharacterized membrane protein YphA (DoxX/SURF4 family)